MSSKNLVHADDTQTSMTSCGRVKLFCRQSRIRLKVGVHIMHSMITDRHPQRIKHALTKDSIYLVGSFPWKGVVVGTAKATEGQACLQMVAPSRLKSRKTRWEEMARDTQVTGRNMSNGRTYLKLARFCLVTVTRSSNAITAPPNLNSRRIVPFSFSFSTPSILQAFKSYTLNF